MRRGGGVSGAVSLVMIFCVLCLSVFAVLTLATAQREKTLADLTAQRAAEYYAADAEATRIVAALASGALADEAARGSFTYSSMSLDGGDLDFTVPINDAQELHVRAAAQGDGCEILCWETVYAGDWETDGGIDLFDSMIFD